MDAGRARSDARVPLARSALLHHTDRVTDSLPAAAESEHTPWGVRVDRVHTPAGEVRLAPSRCHRLRLHVGRPVKGTCSQAHAYVYTRGDIDLLPAGYDDVCVQQNATSSLLIEMSPQLLRRAADDLGLPARRTDLDLRHQLRDKQLELVALALDAESAADHPSGRLYAESLGLALAARLLRTTPTEQRRTPRGLSPSQRARLVEYIDAHLDQSLSLQRVARVAGTSPSHLKTLFKRSMGVTLHAYIVQQRVERARQLLQRGHLPASQVALESGFSHQSHMARCMRRLLGVAPSELRGR